MTLPDALLACLPHLRCPLCAAPLAAAPGGLRCARGHAFDAARQGYVSLLAGPAPGPGDGADMVAARAAFLAAGHYRPLADALAARAAAHAPRDGLVVEVGAGTAYHLACVLEAGAGWHGLAIDLSKYAARRAAHAHPRAAALVCDARARLPVGDGAAALVLDVFAPRHGPELRRILRPDGALLVVTPTARHLHELRGPFQLLDVDPDKERRVAEALGGAFDRVATEALEWPLALRPDEVDHLVGMGPSAHHGDPARRAAARAALPAQVAVTAAVTVEVYRPREGAAPGKGP